MSTPEVVDGTAEDMTPEVAPVESEPSQLPARRERRSEVIRALPVEQLAESFREYQELLPKLLEDSDYQSAGFDKKTGKERKFVKKSGWRKIATAFDLDVVRVSDSVEYDANGSPVRAMAVWRAVSPSGRSMEGDGYCSVDEDRFKRPDSRKKLENDLRATATTRAKNRAISDLVGMGDVSAEEVSDVSSGGGSVPPWALPGDGDELTAAIGRALTCAGVPAEQLQAAGSHVWGTAQAAGGGAIPQIIGPVMDAMGRAIVQARQAAEQATAPPADAAAEPVAS